MVQGGRAQAESSEGASELNWERWSLGRPRLLEFTTQEGVKEKKSSQTLNIEAQPAVGEPQPARYRKKFHEAD